MGRDSVNVMGRCRSCFQQSDIFRLCHACCSDVTCAVRRLSAVVGPAFRPVKSMNLNRIDVWRVTCAHFGPGVGGEATGKPTRKRGPSLPGGQILVNLSVFHNDEEVLGGVFDELDVFQRVAINQKQVCECALFHNTKLAGIGIDKSGECH
jgi:hypothetical protein